jgi:hypothetical protein
MVILLSKERKSEINLQLVKQTQSETITIPLFNSPRGKQKRSANLDA